MAETLDLPERIAVIARLKEYLVKQRGTFQSYLNVLDKEEESIHGGNIEVLQVQARLEQSIVEDIYAFQKVIDPLTEMYRMAYPHSESEIPSLQDSLDAVRTQVLARSERNRTLLKKSMVEVRQEIASLRIPKRPKSPYGDVSVPSMIDIQT